MVVNDPASVRNAPEKLFVPHFEGVMPPTLITADRAEIIAFREEHEDFILKPLFGNGGAVVLHIIPGDENLTALLAMVRTPYRERAYVDRSVPQRRAGGQSLPTGAR